MSHSNLILPLLSKILTGLKKTVRDQDTRHGYCQNDQSVILQFQVELFKEVIFWLLVDNLQLLSPVEQT